MTIHARLATFWVALVLGLGLGAGVASAVMPIPHGPTIPTTAPGLPGELTPRPHLAAPAAPASKGESVKGSLKDAEREPVAGVTITVTKDGADVGTATSDETGKWQVDLPGPGTYDVALDPATLPEGVAPAEGGEKLSGVVVRPNQSKGVIFKLAAGDAADAGSVGGLPGWVGNLAQLVVDGLRFGAIIAITAVGLSLVFGTTKLINFAHGEFVTLGAVVAFWLSTSPGNLPIALAAVLAMIVTGLAAGGIELAVWRPMRRRGAGLIQMFIVAIGLSLVVRHLILVVFGSRRQQYDDYNLQKSWDLGLVRITPRDLVITLLAFAVMIGVAVMLQRTRIGKAMRAVNDNRDLAQASGIDVERVVMIVWLIGGALAGLGGVLFGLTQAVYPEMGFTLLLMMFAGVILGGLGSAYGAMLGSVIIGLVAQLSTLWFPASLQYMWALLVMILMLLVRPQGLLGRRERVG